MFSGNEFMQMGRMTPGPVLPQMSTFGEKKGGPSFTFGGHITERKYPKQYNKQQKQQARRKKKGGKPAKRPEAASRNTPNSKTVETGDGIAGGKQKRRKRRPLGGDRASRARAAAQRRQKRLADKDYSWLHEGEKKVKVRCSLRVHAGLQPSTCPTTLQGTYKKSVDGNDLGSALYRSSSSCNFGTGNRFNPFVYMAHSPSVGKLYTDSPGPCYVPKADMGTGPSARFPAGPKMEFTPEERTRLMYPGPGQYNLLLEHRLEERELTKKLDERGHTVDADGNVVMLGGGTIVEEGDDDNETLADSDEDAAVIHTVENPDSDKPDTKDETGDLAVTHVDGVDRSGHGGSPTPATTKVVRNLHKSNGDGAGSGGGEGASGSPSAAPGTPGSRGTPSPTKRRAARSPGAPSFRRVDSAGKFGRTTSSKAMNRSESLANRASTAPAVKPLSRAKTRAQLSAARPASSRKLVKKASMLTPDPPNGPPVPINALKSHKSMHLRKVQRSFPDTGAPEGVKFAKGPGMRGAGSYRFSQSSRDVEYWKMYRGAENAPYVLVYAASVCENSLTKLMLGLCSKAIDSPGPGTYELASSSFKPANPHGPPHTFGATNHEINYETDSPGPLQYNAVPKSAYSPQFGFGASSRGANYKTYGGAEEFMSKGTLGPGMFLVHSNLADLIKGGVISGSRRELGRIHPEKAAFPGPGTYAVEEVNLKKGPSTQFA